MNTPSDRVPVTPGLHSSTATPSVLASSTSTTPEAQAAPTVKGAFGHHFRAPVQRLVVKMGRDTAPDISRDASNYANVMEVDEAAEVAAGEAGGPVVRYEEEVKYYDEKKPGAALSFVGHGSAALIGEVPPDALAKRIADPVLGLPADAKTPIYLYACNAGSGELKDAYPGALMRHLTGLGLPQVSVRAPRAWLTMLRRGGGPPARAVYQGGPLVASLYQERLAIIARHNAEFADLTDAARETRLHKLGRQLEQNTKKLAAMESAALAAEVKTGPAPAPSPSASGAGESGGSAASASAAATPKASTGPGRRGKVSLSPAELLGNQRVYVAQLQKEYAVEAEKVAAARHTLSNVLPGALAKMWTDVQAKQIELLAAAEVRAEGEGGEAKHDPGEWAGANFWRGWVGLDAGGPIEPGPPPRILPAPPPLPAADVGPALAPPLEALPQALPGPEPAPAPAEDPAAHLPPPGGHLPAPPPGPEHAADEHPPVLAPLPALEDPAPAPEPAPAPAPVDAAMLPPHPPGPPPAPDDDPPVEDLPPPPPPPVATHVNQLI